jgi:hypothetical protein
MSLLNNTCEIVNEFIVLQINLNRSNEKMKMTIWMSLLRVMEYGDFDTPACLQHCHNKIDAQNPTLLYFVLKKLISFAFFLGSN